MISDALKLSGDLRALAEESGLSYAALHSWRTGRATPRPHNLKRLAAALRRRGTTLQSLADQLDRAAGEG